MYAIIVFLIIFILYSQITFQLKKGDDLEIYETDYTNNKELNDSANMKQPFLFSFSNYDNNLKNISLRQLILDYGSFDVFVKDNTDYYADKPVNSIILTLNASSALMKTDPDAKYYSDGNQYFIEETGIVKYYSQFDKYLKPGLNIFSKYDIIFGTEGATTPLIYHTYERRFLYITSGKVLVKMIPWRSTKYMVINKNYKEYEFSSPLNVWKAQDQYMGEFHKMKFLEFTVYPGHILYVPPFWHYSLKFLKDEKEENHLIHVFNYGSLMNVVSNTFNLGHHYLEKIKKQERSSEKENSSGKERSSEKENSSGKERSSEKENSSGKENPFEKENPSDNNKII